MTNDETQALLDANTRLAEALDLQHGTIAAAMDEIRDCITTAPSGWRKEQCLAAIKRIHAETLRDDLDVQCTVKRLNDRYRQALVELGVEITGELKQLSPLYRLVVDLIPDRKTILEQKLWISQERRRREESDKRVDVLRDAIERVLCDGPSKTEAVRILEAAMRESEYSEADA